MAIVPKLELRHSQNLVMTQKLQQAIKLLQMSSLEIEQFVEKQLLENPFLEKEEELLNTADTPDISENDKENLLEEEYSADSWDKADRDNNFDRNDENWLEKTVASENTLREHITVQINTTFRKEDERLIALYLLENLDDSGYFLMRTKDIAEVLGCKEQKVLSALFRMQQFSPGGIFARDVKECLAIQLKELDRFDPAMERLIDNIELLARKDFNSLKKVCEVDEEDLKDMINEIKALNPKPSSGWNYALSPPIIPEVFVKRDKLSRWIVEINPETIPRLLINHEYMAVVQQGASSKDDKRYMKELLSNASWLMKSLHQRNITILKVAEEIIRFQQDFLEKGVEHLKPLTLKDVAAVIGMHESTISRVSNNKYMATPRGIYELKYFFTSSLPSSKNANTTSSEAVKHKIKNYIENESKNGVLSDEDLAIILRNDGIEVARRTVAKYREALGISTSAQRKRAKRIL